MSSSTRFESCFKSSFCFSSKSSKGETSDCAKGDAFLSLEVSSSIPKILEKAKERSSPEIALSSKVSGSESSTVAKPSITESKEPSRACTEESSSAASSKFKIIAKSENGSSATGSETSVLLSSSSSVVVKFISASLSLEVSNNSSAFSSVKEGASSAVI